ncbi:hypothetical protein [Culicoidibacter larvae]|nr:hypothetical protein [Culicoidibacter larvae]
MKPGRFSEKTKRALFITVCIAIVPIVIAIIWALYWVIFGHL